LQIEHKLLRIPTGGRLTSWSGVKELNSGLPRTNPARGREEALNQGPPDFKSSAPIGHTASTEFTGDFSLELYSSGI